jgi:sialidase-1
MRVGEAFARVSIIPLGLLAVQVWLSGCNASRKAEQARPEIPVPEQTDLFIGGQGDYRSYRIPALITTQKGTVLAFVEGRKDSSADHGHNEILLRRSLDGGKTWGPVQLVAKDGTNALNNPTAAVDRDTGTTWLMFIRTSTQKYKDNAEVAKARGRISDLWVMQSNDEGATWIGPRDITKSVNRPSWNRIVPGPGVGIQMRSGRLVIPFNHLIGNEAYDHVIYSDDHGKTWRLGGSTEADMDEDQIVELADGSLLLNIRNYRDKGHRGIASSKDGGLTWSRVSNDATLIEPVCQASLVRYTASPQFTKDRLLFSNPASATERIKMTVRVSYDEGKTWPVGRLLNAGPSGYSCLTVLPDMTIGCLYERGDHSSIEKVTFARFSLAWLTDGADSLQKPR